MNVNWGKYFLRQVIQELVINMNSNLVCSEVIIIAEIVQGGRIAFSVVDALGNTLLPKEQIAINV